MNQATETGTFSAEQLETGRLLFAGPCDFVLSVADMKQLPEPGPPEVAFAGRSNVGKSSLLNALTNRKNLARTSNTPGRTQMLNYFSLGGAINLVDMPGYGFAKAPKEKVRDWTILSKDFLAGRASLVRVFLLIDSRHGLKDSDSEVMDLLDKTAVVYQCILTKSDKPKGGDLHGVLAKLTGQIAKRPAAHPSIIMTSSAKMRGIEELRAEIASLVMDR
ncbi:MAG: YihA family ribosome biogenesis GTP-binding protein [Rhizobiales bacterium]|nr:YihA family ribosome biogenesis GTP-binding protein [Hyphomicrobiales bacterium]